MKKKNNHILPALVLTASLGLTAVSCNGFLDEMPDNRTELNTDQKIAKLLVSAYADACRGKCSSPLPQGVPLAKRVRAVAVRAAALGLKRVSRKRWLSVPFVWG